MTMILTTEMIEKYQLHWNLFENIVLKWVELRCFNEYPKSAEKTKSRISSPLSISYSLTITNVTDSTLKRKIVIESNTEILLRTYKMKKKIEPVV